MQLRFRGSTLVARAAGRRAAPPRVAPLLAALLLALALGAALLASSAYASGEHDEHDEVAPERLDGRELCLDPSSVAVRLAGLAPGRADAMRTALLRDLRRQLRTDLRAGGVRFRDASCVGAEGFVLVDLWLTELDPSTYRAYRSGSYGLGVSLQVGDYADRATLERVHLLPDLRFEAFAEEIVDRPGNAPIDRRAVRVARDLLADLVAAWREANP